MIKLALLGASGKMGRAIEGLVMDECRQWFSIAGRWQGRATSAIAGAVRHADVAIDFSAPDAAADIADAVAARGIPLVCGTTGHSDDQRGALEALAARVPLLLDSNMSVAIQLMAELAARAAAVLEGYDAEIIETHHRDKRDAPSGTALKLGAAVADARGQALADVAAHDRTGPRRAGAIGFAVSRGGRVVGEHRLTLHGDWDALQLTHTAADRRLFARGALDAARWLAGQSPGLYSIASLLRERGA